MSDTVAPQDPFDLRWRSRPPDYACRIAELVERARSRAVLSATEAYAAAELLGQYARLDPTGELNQLAATLAGRVCSRSGAARGSASGGFCTPMRVGRGWVLASDGQALQLAAAVAIAPRHAGFAADAPTASARLSR
jgi:hypothetical protein